jgi:hypothetical protein
MESKELSLKTGNSKPHILDKKSFLLGNVNQWISPDFKPGTPAVYNIF